MSEKNDAFASSSHESEQLRHAIETLNSRAEAGSMCFGKGVDDLLSRMCSTVPDLLWAKDLRKRYVFANAAMREKLLCAGRDEDIAGLTDLFFAERQRKAHPENPYWHTFGEICSDSDNLVIASGLPQRFEECGNVRGEFLFLDVYKAPFFDAEGNLVGTVGCGRDVTAEKRLELQFRAIADRHQALISASPDGYMLLDTDGSIIDVNDGHCSMLGYPREELLQMNFADLETQESGERVASRLARVVEVRSDRFETLLRKKTAL